MASSAWAMVSHTITPLPAASPDALTTTGAPNLRTQALASFTLLKTPAAAVGTPASSMICLAKALEVSISAAACDGPNAAMPASRIRSTRPAARGASGPTTTRSTARSTASATNRSTSAAAKATHSASSAIPGFPGAAMSEIEGSSCLNFQASACSRPPPPITSSFISLRRARLR